MQPAAQDHRGIERANELGDSRVVGAALVTRDRRARMDGDRADTRLRDEAVCKLDPGAVAATPAGAQLHGHREAASFARRPGEGNRALTVIEQGGAGARAADLRHRAAHVQVDHVHPEIRDVAGSAAHHGGVRAEELDRDRAIVALPGIDPQQLAERAGVAVVDCVARDHLGDGEAGAVAARLEAYEPVADASQRCEDHPVWQLEISETPAVGQRGHTLESSGAASADRGWRAPVTQRCDAR